MLEYYIQHQVDVIRRRTKFDLDKTDQRHVLEGLIKAVDILDAVIETIRKSPNEPEAKSVCGKFNLPTDIPGNSGHETGKTYRTGNIEASDRV